MKKHMSFVALLIVALGLMGLTGCNKEKEAKATEQPAVEAAAKKVDATAKEHPATAKPKDHPAH